MSLNEHSHPRIFRDNQYVYPVLSRRAGGVSVGINLSPNRTCNFHCIYCQVNRSTPSSVDSVVLSKLFDELKWILANLVNGGMLWQEPEFSSLPPEKAKVTDIAFSGDGEPTAFKNFSEVAQGCVEIKEQLGFADIKVVLITNATGLRRPDVRRGLAILDQHHGEVWAKLDAGTPEYFAQINGTKFHFPKILSNILQCAREREIVIQSCFARIEDQEPSFEQISAYVARLQEIVKNGGKIKLLQIYTIARQPACSTVSSLANKDVDALAERIKRETQLPTVAFYGHATSTYTDEPPVCRITSRQPNKKKDV